MIDRIRGILPPRAVEKPRDWEDSVAKSLTVLNFQLQSAEEAKEKAGEAFMAEKHAEWVRGRVKNLKDVVLETAAKERSIFQYPQFIAVESDKTYFYIPNANKLISAREQAVVNGVGKVSYVPDLTSAEDVDEKTWCLDRVLVENLAKELVALLPKKSSKRILEAARFV